eukprot:TRINITY_DN30270_c1_g5_i1.p1 TRINITY_DN30270_c1_g5~~TRINITY_DN30270_c1_g5_i1.p1  ORF type:complete len:586 (+),score=152.46 TRINITY_DN30270_c1_g5_i1:132-1889(+)
MAPSHAGGSPGRRCWSDVKVASACCSRSGLSRSDCWSRDRTFDACCGVAEGSGGPGLFGVADFVHGYNGLLASLVTLVAVAGLCARDIRRWRFQRDLTDARRRQRLDLLQQGVAAGGSAGGAGAGVRERAQRPAAACGSTGAGVRKAASLSAGELKATSSVDAVSNIEDDVDAGYDCCSLSGDIASSAAALGTPVSASDSTPRSPGLLDCGEAVLIEFLAALDGACLARLECASRWRRNVLGVASLAGVWRLVHVRALGGRPPAKLARSLGPAKADASVGPGGPWKRWWCWRQAFLALSESDRLKVTESLARRFVDLRASTGQQQPRPGQGVVHVAEANVQPMMPHERWVDGLLERLALTLSLDFRGVPDDRLAPLARRWHNHVLFGAEVVLADESEFHTDHIELFMSCSVSFAALAGQPRLFVGALRRSAAAESVEVDLVHCAIAPRSIASLSAVEEEIVAFLAPARAGDFSAALCGASSLARLTFGPAWTLRRCEMAPSTELLALRKELLGEALDPRASRDAEAAADASSLQVLQWLLAALCPNPFGDGSEALRLTSQSLADALLRRRSAAPAVSAGAAPAHG